MTKEGKEGAVKPRRSGQPKKNRSGLLDLETRKLLFLVDVITAEDSLSDEPERAIGEKKKVLH